jgi:hypothetical protein
MVSSRFLTELFLLLLLLLLEDVSGLTFQEWNSTSEK